MLTCTLSARRKKSSAKSSKRTKVSGKPVTLQSKAGIRIPGLKEEDTVGYYDLSKDYILAQVEQSLSNLGVDSLDVFLFHRPDPLVRVEEIADLVDTLHSSGKVKAFGVSNMAGAQIRRWQSVLPQPLKVNQIQMSLGHRDFIEAGVTFNHASETKALWFAEGTMEACAELGLEIQAWSPLHEGVFTGRPTNNPKFQKAAALVWDLSRKYLCSPESLVLSWLLVLPQAVRPVIGTTHLGRLDACRDAEKVELSKQDWYRLWTTVRGASLP
jgi:predicted oxidoreductase